MHTDKEIQRAAQRALDAEPAEAKMSDASDLRAIAEAADAVTAAQARVRESVELARAHGRSWGQIGLALGVSRQAARERFGEKVKT